MSTNTIRLGGGHCCACSTVCHHIGGPFYCASHDPARAAIRDHFAAREDEAFIERLRTRLREDKRLLDHLEEQEHRPCPATYFAVLGMVGEPAQVRCGLLDGHRGHHVMHIEWL